MRLLVIGKDPYVVRPGSASGKRQTSYYEGWQTEIVVISPGERRTIELAPGIKAQATGGKSKLAAFWLGLKLSIRTAKTFQPDLVTCQDPFDSGIIAYFVASLSRCRLQIQDHSGFFARQSCGWKERLLRPVALFLLRRASGARTVSERGASGIRRHALSGLDLSVSPVACDLGRFFSSVREPEKQHVVCVARLSHEKGLDILLKAAAEVARRFPDFKLTIVGGGSEREALSRMRLDLSLVSVDFAGWVDPLPYLRKAEIYVQPSRLEGWGIAVTEAAAMGLPIVMTNVGCAGEVIRNEESGLVVPPSDHRALALALIRLLSDENLRQRLGSAAQVAARSLPDAEARRLSIRGSLERTAQAERPSRGLAWIFMAAVAARLLVWLVILLGKGAEGLMLADSEHYITLAQSILSGEGFTMNGEPFAYRTFGYPILVAIGLSVLKSVPAVLFVQAIAGALIALQTYWLARELGVRARFARLAAWIVAFEPHLVFYSLPMLTEVPFTLLFLGSLVSGLRAIRGRSVALATWSGLLAGLSMMVKPLLQLWPAFILAGGLVSALTKPKNARRVALGITAFLVAMFLSSFPSLAWYKINFGTWAYSNQGLMNTAQYLSPTLISMRDKVSYQEAERIVDEELARRYGVSTLVGKDLGPQYFEYAKQVILDNPGLLLKSIAITTVTYWTSHNYAYIPHRYGLIPEVDRSVLPPTHLLAQGRYADFFASAGKIFLQPFYFFGAVGRLIWAVISLAFFWSLFRSIMKDSERRMAHVLILGLCIYFVITVLANGLGIEGRLRYHLMPVMFVYIALLVERLRMKRRS